MSKYKVKFKLQGLEFEIEGEKDDIPSIANGVRNQFAALLSPVDATEPKTTVQLPPMPITIDGVSRKKGAKRSPGSTKTGATQDLPVLQHNAEKFGAPVQSWKAVDKAFWLLRVVTDQTEVKELSGTALAELFGKYFRRKGSLRPSNISRDFGKASKLVMENTNVDPAVCYWLDEE